MREYTRALHAELRTSRRSATPVLETGCLFAWRVADVGVLCAEWGWESCALFARHLQDAGMHVAGAALAAA